MTKQKTKQRVIAIDYFRGICILIVVLNHASIFTWPYSNIFGGSGLWTSAAEMFFLLSGITLWIVRGESLKNNFRATTLKIWRRAGIIYFTYVIAVLISLCLGLFLSSKNLFVDMPGILGNFSSTTLLIKILTFNYSVGWANFLMYYSLFLLLAPLALKTLQKKFWLVIPIGSAILYVLAALGRISNIDSIFTWQFYFFGGLTLARFRPQLISRFYSLDKNLIKSASRAIVLTAALLLLLPKLLLPTLHNFISRLVNDGWLPQKINGATGYLIAHQSTINYYLDNNRMGLLRPLVTFLVFSAGYIIYQRYKKAILKVSGYFVNSMGRDTLWLFVAQALIIPLLAALPLQRNLVNNAALTIILVTSLWLITQRQMIRKMLSNSLRSVATSLVQPTYDEDS